MPMAKHNSPRQMRGRMSLLDVLGRVFEQDRSALAVGDEMKMRRRVGDAKLFGHDVAFQLAAFMSAIALRPGHADPALGADAAAESAVIGVAMAGLVRIESAGGDFFRQERAHLGAQRLRIAGGRRIGSKCSSASSRGHQWPEFVGAATGDTPAKLRRPVAFVAEVVAPGQHTQREAVQHVLLRKADGAEDLMRDRRAFGGGFGGADFGRCGFQETQLRRMFRLARWRRPPSPQRRARRRLRRRAARGFAAPPGICRSAARRRRAHWRRRRRATGSFPARRRSRRCGWPSPSAAKMSDQSHPAPARYASGLTRSKRDDIRCIACKIAAFAQPAIFGLDQRDQWLLSAVGKHGDMLAVCANGTPRRGRSACRRHRQ